MPHLLHLDSSAAGDASRSRQLTATFAATWRAVGPQHTVTHRDLHRSPIPHLPDAALHWPPRLRQEARLRQEGSAPAEPEEGSALAEPERFAAAEALQNELIDELLAADVLLVGAPLYNYSVPSTLKAWIDHIHVPGRTAPFDIPSQPLAGRPAVVITSRGGSYDEGTRTAGWDHAVPALELVLGTALGMTVEVITTSLTLAETVVALADQRDRARAELAAAYEAAAEAARRLAAKPEATGRGSAVTPLPSGSPG
jgi:FMN-dependent NADH-azoreductase